MPHLFTMLPFAVPASDAPLLAGADYKLLVNYEPDAYGHWVLGPSASSLTDKVASRALTPAGTGHSYSATSVSIPADGTGELSSDFAEVQDMTACAVVTLPTLGNGQGIVAFGNYNSTVGFGANIIYSTVTSLYSESPVIRGVSAFSLRTLTGLTAGQKVFTALSMSFSGANSVIRYVGGFAPLSSVPATEKTAAAIPVALGNAQYVNVNYNAVPTEAHEFMIFNRALNAAELDAVYARSKARMADRGVTVF